MSIQYGSRDREARTFGPSAPEGELTEEQLRENREEMPIALGSSDNEFIDDQFFQDRMTSEDLSKIDVPILSAGNWVCNYLPSDVIRLLILISVTGWDQSPSPW